MPDLSLRKLPKAFAFVGVLLAAAPLAFAQTLAPAGQPPLPAGTAAPAFATKTLAGRPLTLKSLRGHVVLLDYWATWCGPCRMATPTLESLHRKFGGRGLRVVGMSVDDAHSVGAVPAFIRQFGITYTVTVSPAANAAAARAYHAQGIPSQYLIDKKGVVRWSQSGFSPSEGTALSSLIAKLQGERG